MVGDLKFLPEKLTMKVKEFKFFHGITLHTEGIQEIIRTLRMRMDMDTNLTRTLIDELVNDVEDEIIELNDVSLRIETNRNIGL